MIFQKIFLLKSIHFGHSFQLSEMRPAFVIRSLQFIVAAGRKQAAHGHVHQVLFLFLGKFFFDTAELLYPYQEKDRFHIRFLLKPLYQLRLQRPPSCLQIVLYIHKRKDKYRQPNDAVPGRGITRSAITRPTPSWFEISRNRGTT